MAAKKILLILHQERSDPGRVGEALRTLGYELDMRIPAIGHALPEDPHEHRAAVVFGGPMSANDDHEPYIREETKYVERALKAELPYFGICLGAQIMARTFGANVKLHPKGRMEIGYHPIYPAETPNQHFDRPLNVYQWHKEGFDLPSDCSLLAKGEHFPNQAFQYGENAFGIQFHPEVTEAMSRKWLNKASHMLVETGAQPADEQLTDRLKYDHDVRQWLDKFLMNWIGTPK